MRTGKAGMMQRKMVSNLLLIGTITLAIAGPVIAAEDPYLQGLREEASKLEQLGQAKKEYERLERQHGGQQLAPVEQKESTRQSQKKAVSASSTAPLSPADVAAFENGLREYPAGYGLYRQLDTKERQAVFREYAQTAGHPGTRYIVAIKLIILLSTGTP